MNADALLSEIAAYVVSPLDGEAAFEAASWSLADALGCAILSLQFAECRRRLGPVVDGAVLSPGCRVPGTSFELDPVQGAFNIGSMIRWLDYNDTWLAAEWGHPSDNIGGLLAVSDWLARRGTPVTVRRLLEAQIKAYEIQGVLALENSFNRIGLDHVILVKIASAAAAAWLMGASGSQLTDILSNAWIDLGPLRTYRHAPNTGARKSWAAGDATARGVRLALMGMAGEPGYASALSAPRWGFQDAMFGGRTIRLGRPLGSYVAENILFKISFPVEFHAQTAVEAALSLHPRVKDRLESIRAIRIKTQESALRIIDKKGPLANPADRDHCLQYAVAVALITGGLRAEDYEDEAARDPRIDRLRAVMTMEEDPRYSADYLDPSKRSIANSIQIMFQDGTSTDDLAVEYPIGHRRRRAEGVPLLFRKLRENLASRLQPDRVEQIVALFQDRPRLERTSVPALVDLLLETAEVSSSGRAGTPG
ncbi:MAG TPA: bifunctional 2-methylcitrate dehydratase/aconitate hydratase [Spirochaetia bacterium]|nr:bifunctional 2-methylcitrate dehydratase/aconitate hydratase [Spirochaetia bacterium]